MDRCIALRCGSTSRTRPAAERAVRADVDVAGELLAHLRGRGHLAATELLSLARDSASWAASSGGVSPAATASRRTAHARRSKPGGATPQKFSGRATSPAPPAIAASVSSAARARLAAGSGPADIWTSATIFIGHAIPSFMFAILLIIQLHCSTAKARARKEEALQQIALDRKTLFASDKDSNRFVRFLDEYSVLTLLILVILGGAFLSVYVLSKITFCL